MFVFKYSKSENYHTLALEGVPKFGIHNRTAAYRFVTLVDVRKAPQISLFGIYLMICWNYLFIGDVWV